MTQETPTSTNSSSRPAWPSLLIALLSGVGIVLAIILTHTHAQLLAQPDYESFCDISAKVSCTDALTSPYAKLLGVPVSLFAAISYALLLVLAFWDSKHLEKDGAAHRVFALSAFHLLFSLYLFAVSVVELGVICPLCSGLYAVALLNTGLAWKNLPAGIGNLPKGLSEEIGGLLRGPKSRWAIEGGAALAVLALVLLFQAADPLAPKTKGEPHPQKPVAGKPGEPEQVPTDPAEKREFYKKKMREWLASMPEVKADFGAFPPNGTPGAPVTIVEFADFQCPACKRAGESLDRALKRHPGKIRWYFRNFPLNKQCNPALTSELHTQACQAAYAAWCANEQGAFWKYNEHLFLYQPRLASDQYVPWAKELGLDAAKFEKCLKDKKGEGQIQADVSDGMGVEVSSTPTVIINGRKLKVLPPDDEVIDILIEVAEEMAR
ncbi:MAG: vitamin K epoxide reductase family protein [Bdellovibrionota bacterium]